jgi:hypothetical protein
MVAQIFCKALKSQSIAVAGGNGAGVDLNQFAPLALF